MKVRCRLHWHRWKNWVWVAATPAEDEHGARWGAAQMRQCADCWLIETTKSYGYAINLKPLRDSVQRHVADLRGCVKAIDESEHAEAFKETRDEIAKAADELNEAVRIDMGDPNIKAVKAD